VDLSRDLGHWHGLKVKGQKMFCNCPGFLDSIAQGRRFSSCQRTDIVAFFATAPWVVPEKIGSFQKRSTLPPPPKKFLPCGWEKKLFLIIVNVLGHPKGVGDGISNFLRGGGMDDAFCFTNK
jgi:hypothetical protein